MTLEEIAAALRVEAASSRLSGLRTNPDRLLELADALDAIQQGLADTYAIESVGFEKYVQENTEPRHDA